MLLFFVPFPSISTLKTVSEWKYRATACCLHAAWAKKHLIIPFFVPYSFVHYSSSVVLLILYYLLYEMTGLVSNGLEVSLRWGDDDGTKIREKACESGWYSCDSTRRVPTVGHLGHTSPREARGHVTSKESPAPHVDSCARDDRRLELSVCYHMSTSHFRTPSLLSSYHHHLLIVGSLRSPPLALTVNAALAH